MENQREPNSCKKLFATTPLYRKYCCLQQTTAYINAIGRRKKMLDRFSLTGANISFPSREPSASDWRAMYCPMDSRIMSSVALVGVKLLNQLESQFDSINSEFTVSS